MVNLNLVGTTLTYCAGNRHSNLFKKTISPQQTLFVVPTDSFQASVQEMDSTNHRGCVPERPISANRGLKFCSVFVSYLFVYCLE